MLQQQHFQRGERACGPSVAPRRQQAGTRLSAAALGGPGGPEGPFKSGGGPGEQLGPVVFRFTDTAPPQLLGVPQPSSAASRPSGAGSVPAGAASGSGGSASSSFSGAKGASAGGSGQGAASSNGKATSPSSTNGSGSESHDASGHGNSHTVSASAAAAGTLARDVAAGDGASGANGTPASGSSYSDFYRSVHSAPYSRPQPASDGEKGAGGTSSQRPAAPQTDAPVSHSSPLAFRLAPGTSPAGADVVGGDDKNGNGTSSSSTPPTSGADVAEALARAHAALSKAESSLDDIQRLNDTSMELRQPLTRWQIMLRALRGAVGLSALALAMLASHAFGLAGQWVGAALGAAAIASWGMKRGSLSSSGAAAAALVGCGTLGSSLRFGATLVAFFLSSSKLTSYKEELKEGLDESSKKGGQRTWVQVGPSFMHPSHDPPHNNMHAHTRCMHASCVPQHTHVLRTHTVHARMHACIMRVSQHTHVLLQCTCRLSSSK